MKIESAAIASLHADPANARTHSPRNLDAIKASLQAFGQQKPIVVDADNVVVAGNGTLDAAKQLGWSEIDIVRTDLTGSARAGFAIADNRTAELAEWDDAALAQTLAALQNDAAFDELVAGFNADEIDRLIYPEGKPGLTDPDAIPENVEPISKPGDLWILGNHRLLCGDSTKAEDVGRVMGGVVPFIMVTDPPYGVNYDADWRNHTGDQFRTARRCGVVSNDDRFDWTDTYKLFAGDVAYVWHAGIHAAAVSQNLATADMLIRAQIIWVKQTQVFGRGAYHWKHEPCWYAVRSNATAKWCGDRTQSTAWEIPNHNPMGGKQDDADTEHSTQKPVECMARPIRNHGGQEDDVYDPFCGSGTTIIAAEQLNRRCFAIEIEPKYVDVAVKRWENFTGKTASKE